jgi:hypothetical protein
MKSPKIDTSGTEKAQQAIAAAQNAASTLNKNFQADLSANNVAQVVPGGGAADMLNTANTSRKKRGSGGLASQLGINV